MHTPWTEAEAALLKRLREQALLTPAVFAKRHALSNGQLRELEQGGQGSFYSEDIKAYNGRKLLKTLGYTAPVEPVEPVEPELPAAPVATASGASAIEPVPTDKTDAIETVAATEPTAEVVETHGEPPAPQETILAAQEAAVVEATPLHAPDASRTAPPGPTPVANPPSGASTWALAGLGLVAAVGVFWVTSGSRTSPAPSSTPPSEPVAVPASVAPAASASEAGSDAPPSAQPAASGASSPSSSPVAAAMQALPTKWPAGCEPIAGKPTTAYQSPVADRPDTYVHVESIQDVQVCVIDGQNRPTPLNLKTGQSFTVYGTAPFVVRSPQWQGLKIFFQGMRVQVEPGQPTDQVVLNSRRGA